MAVNASHKEITEFFYKLIKIINKFFLQIDFQRLLNCLHLLIFKNKHQIINPNWVLKECINVNCFHFELISK